jgi:hypothetical protein
LKALCHPLAITDFTNMKHALLFLSGPWCFSLVPLEEHFFQQVQDSALMFCAVID